MMNFRISKRAATFVLGAVAAGALALTAGGVATAAPLHASGIGACSQATADGISLLQQGGISSPSNSWQDVSNTIQANLNNGHITGNAASIGKALIERIRKSC